MLEAAERWQQDKAVVAEERLAPRSTQKAMEKQRERNFDIRESTRAILLIERRDAGPGVNDPDDRLGFIDGESGLLEDVGRDDRLIVRDDPTRVDQLEGLGFPLDLAVDAVAGDAGLVADDRLSRTGEAIKERRLADVRTAYDCDQW